MGEVMRVPWITHEAKKYLDTIVKPGMQVFEWGSGGSTVYFGLKGAEVVTIEHDKSWHGDVAQEIERLGLTSRCTLHLIPAQAGRIEVHPEGYWPDNYFEPHPTDEFHNSNFKRYACAIDKFANGYFDIIMVDGMVRGACLKRAAGKLKRGGYLIWDNSDREYDNRHTKKLFDQWSRAVFYGFGPVNAYRWETTIWKKEWTT